MAYLSWPRWPKSADAFGCRDPPSQQDCDFCYLWKHWSHNADVKKFNDIFVRNAAISLKERKTAALADKNPRFLSQRAKLRLKTNPYHQERFLSSKPFPVIKTGPGHQHEAKRFSSKAW